MGCSMDEDSTNFIDNHTLDTRLIGKWESPYGDWYAITKSENEITLTCGFSDPEYGEFQNYAGTIVYVSNFSDNAGVIVIEYIAGSEQMYPEYDENWNITGYIQRKGDFLGIYYKNLKTNSVQLSGAYDDGPAEEATSYEAVITFTQGNAGKYAGIWGVYTK
jgi:hypothetical protein